MNLQVPHFQTDSFARIAAAAADPSRISGLTHNFYRYPARFSPTFASAVIQTLSKPGDIILDPYMGGGTTIVEALAAQRSAIGNDLNSLAIFIARVKTTPLNEHETKAIASWANSVVPNIGYRGARDGLVFDHPKLRNLSITRGRFIKKLIAVAMNTLVKLPTEKARNFVRCAILNTSQWALDGRKMHTPLAQFRIRLTEVTYEMLNAIETITEPMRGTHVTFIEGDAAQIHNDATFTNHRYKVDLVVTSPPYPGVHMLYHRWQVDGRRETPAPYWIANCNDGEGASFYNFGGRKQQGLTSYFEKSLTTLCSIKQVMRAGALIVQMIAFNEPEEQLPRYLRNMELAGFDEVLPPNCVRIWRDVPSRKWHANFRGATHSSREVVLIHRASA